MKKIISLLALTILISSCGNRLSIVKRHYTNGYYVESGKKSRQTDLTKTDANNLKIKKSEPTVVNFLPKDKTTNEELTASAATTTKKEERKNSFQSQIKKHMAQASQKVMTTKKVSDKEPLIFSKKQRKQSSKGGGGDVDLIILVILCFFPFINLIAMYLKDGKSITLNFWIDLILDCLFFLPGIIFALLVVLDVVNLA